MAGNLRRRATLPPPHASVLGGGRAGLAVGWFARWRGLPFTLLEASDRLGIPYLLENHFFAHWLTSLFFALVTLLLAWDCRLEGPDLRPGGGPAPGSKPLKSWVGVGAAESVCSATSIPVDL